MVLPRILWGVVLLGYLGDVAALTTGDDSFQPLQDLTSQSIVALPLMPTTSKFVLVLDDSNSMSSCSRMENLKLLMKRWVDGLRPNTKVAIVKYGSSSQCATGLGTMTKDCYVEISKANNGNEERRYLMTIIDAMGANMGNNYMGEALKNAHTIMKDEHDANQGQPGVVMLVTDGMSGDDISDISVWKPFQMDHIRIITFNLGHEIDENMKLLATETGGRAFVSKDCSGIEGDAFQYASDTFVPSDVGDENMKRQITSQGTYSGIHMMGCRDSNDGKMCFTHPFTIEKSLNKEVNIEMRIARQGQEVDARDVIEEVSVRRRLTNQTIMVKHPEVDGFVLKFDSKFKNFADYYHPGTIDEEYTEEVLDVYLTTKTMSPVEFIRSSVQFVTTAERNFDGEEPADYYITCKHPAVMEYDKEFKIESQVLRGTTPVTYATVVARVTVARESDPDADTPPVYFELMDDGDEEWSGDVHKNDGTYTTRLNPEQLHVDDGTGISVMCNLVESPGAEWNDNNFFG